MADDEEKKDVIIPEIKRELEDEVFEYERYSPEEVTDTFNAMGRVREKFDDEDVDEEHPTKIVVEVTAKEEFVMNWGTEEVSRFFGRILATHMEHLISELMDGPYGTKVEPDVKVISQEDCEHEFSERDYEYDGRVVQIIRECKHCDYTEFEDVVEES